MLIYWHWSPHITRPHTKLDYHNQARHNAPQGEAMAIVSVSQALLNLSAQVATFSA
jgi:hypothetical protein